MATRSFGRMLHSVASAVIMALVLASPSWAFDPGQPKPQFITVIVGDAYPPYSFRSADGQPRGILKDLWDLWSRKTGIEVRYKMLSGRSAYPLTEADGTAVVALNFLLETNRDTLEFSREPIERVDVYAFFHHDINGIADAEGLRGFTIGVFNRGACDEWLGARGITTVRRYETMDALVQGTARGEVNVFCSGLAFANHRLYRESLESRFRRSPPLFSTGIHWGVRKGDTGLRDLIESGFAEITPAERRQIRERWIGVPVDGWGDDAVVRGLATALTLAAAGAALLFFWNTSLRRRVAAETEQLSTALSDLTKSEQLAATIFNTIPDLAWVKDTEGRYLSVNGALAGMLGFATPADMVGKTDFDVSPRDLAEAYRADDAEVMASGLRRRIEELHSRPDGTLFWIETVKTPLCDASGAVTGTVGIARDVTERKAAEDKLRDIATRLEAMIGNVHATAFRAAYSADGNRRLLRIYGTRPTAGHNAAELTAMSSVQLRQLVHPDDWQQEFHDAAEDLRRTGVSDRRRRLITRDGAVRWTRVSERVVGRSGDDLITEGLSFDVTDETLVRQALEASERRYRHLVEALPVGVFEDEVGKGCVYASDLWAELTGLSHDELLGDGWLKAVHPDDLPGLQAMWRRDVEARAVHHSEYRLRHVSGREVWVLVRAMPRFDAEGALSGYVGTITDITYRKQMEAALQASERMFRAIVETTPDLIVRLDRDGRRVYINPAMAEIMNANHLALMGKTPGEVPFADTPAGREAALRAQDAVMTVLRTARTVEAELSWTGPDDREFHFAARYAPELDGNGEVTGVMSVARDITERKRMELALRASEAELRETGRQLRSLIENSPDFIVRFDREARHVYASPSVCRAFGKSVEQIIGKTLAELQVPETAEQTRTLMAGIRAAFDEGTINSTEVHWGTAAGDVTMEVRHIPERDPSGAVVSVLGIARDITKKVRAQMALADSERHYRELVAALPVGIVTVDDCGRLVLCNDAAATISGRQLVAGEVPWWPDGWIYLSDGTPIGREERLSDRVRREGRPLHDVEVFFRRPDGSRADTLVSSTPMRDSSGAVSAVVITLVDITERKRAEEALRDTTHKLETMISNLPGNLFRLRYRADDSKELLFVDGLLARHMGRHTYQPAQVAPEDYRKLFHPDDQELLFVEVPRRLRETGESEQTFRFLTPDGGVAWLRARERVVERSGDEMITEGITLDVTAEMRAEEELRHAHRTLETLISNLPGNVFRLRYLANGLKKLLFADGGVLRQVPGMREWMLALSPEEFAATFPEENRRLLFEEIPRRLRQSGQSEQTFCQTQPDGGVQWLRAWERVVEQDGDEMITEGIVIDVSEEMRAKVSLERINRALTTLSQGNEALVRATDETELFAAMCRVVVETGGYRMAWVGVVDYDAGKTLRPVAHAGVEDGYLSLARISWGDDVRAQGPGGMAIRTGLPQINDDTAANDAMAPWRDAALARGYRSCIALPLKAETGVFGCLGIYAAEPSAFNADEITLLVDLANNLAYGVSAMRERRRREEVERHLSQVQKLEALGQLAGSVAHDFNNLLGAMLGFARFIAEDAAEGDPARHYAQRILAAGQHGKALVGQILSFARRGEVKRGRVAVSQLLADIRTLVGASIPATTRFTVQVADTDAEVEVDADHLTQVMLNLCLNAHDALSGRPGSVAMLARPTVPDDDALLRLRGRSGADAAQVIETWGDEDGTAHAVSGTFDPAADHVSLVVSDEGCGMDTQVLEQAFSPFFTTKVKGAGTGLGLAAVHGIVLAHGGALAVESRVGQGSRFEVVLPRAAGEALVGNAALPPVVALVAPPASCHVLLVDDDPHFGDMLLTGLERRGFEVSPCADPLEALAGMREFGDAWDVMITDYTMPDMTGLELIRAVKAIRPELPCILCTGYSESQLDDHVLGEAGVFALLRKPVDMDELADALARAMREIPRVEGMS